MKKILIAFMTIAGLIGSPLQADAAPKKKVASAKSYKKQVVTKTGSKATVARRATKTYATKAGARKLASKARSKHYALASKNGRFSRVNYASGDNLATELNRGSKNPDQLVIRSASALVLDQSTGEVLYQKNPSAVLPIASITKLMTAMVALDAKPNLTETMAISADDVDTTKGTRSRLTVGAELNREEIMRLALMSSENRAAHALSRYYQGGTPAFIAAMNRKAQILGLQDTHFADPTGLNAHNVSSARDLVKMVDAASHYPLIREYTTTSEYSVFINSREQTFRNSNALVRNQETSAENWKISLSKTGFINEAGKCLVMQAWVNSKPTVIVLLDSIGKYTRLGDATRIKRWIEASTPQGSPSASLGTVAPRS